MHLFYIAPTDLPNTSLSEEESYHCIKVLRYKQNDTIRLVDGKGGKYEAMISNADTKKCKVQIMQKIQQIAPTSTIHIGICPPKASDRLEFFVEKATEIGVDKISFIISQRSERNKVNEERLEKIVFAAAKQSMRAFFPILLAHISFEKFLSQNLDSQKYIAHCNADFQNIFLGKCISPHQNMTILIGPEGDFTAQEIEQALALKYQSISLGETRLRTETAALVALNICQFARQMFF